MNLLEELHKLGLTHTEAKVYTTLLELGGDYVSTIARKSEVKRTNCYHTLKTLSEKGFVSITQKDSSKYFIAEDPRHIIQKQKTQLEIAQGIMPDLLTLKNSPKGLLPKIKYYEGKEGIKNLLFQILESKTDVLTYTNIKQLIDKFPTIFETFSQERSKRNISSKIISPYNKEAEAFIKKNYSEEYIKTSLELLFINPNQFFLKNEVNIYENKVSMISLTPEENIGVLIESELYVDTFRTIFNLSWLGATSFIAK